MTRTHAALVRSAGRVRLCDVPTPAPAAGEVLLAPDVAGVCGTDLQILRGLREDPAPILGHEGSATVVARGSGVDGLDVGTRVTVNPTHPTSDDFLLGHNVNGMWSERVLIPAGAVAAGLVLAAGAPAGALAALVEPLAAAMYGRLVTLAAAPVMPATLVIVGDGVIGHLARRWWRRRDGRLRIVHLHHSEPGLRFSAAHPCPEDTVGVTDLLVDGPGVDATLAADAGPTAAILATPRNATRDALLRVDRCCRTELTVNVHGGVASGLVELSAGAVDVAAIRARNRAGQPAVPASETVHRPGADTITICGQRGVGNDLLEAAGVELTAQPDRYRDLVTHEVDMSTAAGLLNTMASGGREFSGRRVIKTAIRIAG